MRCPHCAVSPRGLVPQSRSDGAAWLRPWRIQVFLVSVAVVNRTVATRVVSASRAGGESLERGDGHRHSLSGRTRRVYRTLPRCGPDAPDTPNASVHDRRL